MGYDYIINYLNKKGYRTAKNKEFSKSSLNTILKNPKYMGTYVYDKSTPKNSEGKRNSHTSKEKYIKIKDGMPAIISEEDFNKVQQKMTKNAEKQTSRTSKNYYSLNSRLHCSKCGKAFSGNVNHSKGKKHFQYRGSCQCKIKSVNMDRLNKSVFYALQQCIFSFENKEKIMKKINTKLAENKSLQSAEINAITNKINGLENAQNNLTGYLENGKGTKTILERIDKNEKELEILKNQLELKSHEIADIDDKTYSRLVNKFMDYMSNEKSPKAKELRNSAISDIKIGENNIDIYLNHGVTADKATVKYFNNVEE